MKKIYIAPFVEVFEEIVDTQILAGSHEVTGAESALTEQSVDIDLENNEYDITKPDQPFLEVE